MNGSPVDLRMNIDETGKIFTRAREDSKDQVQQSHDSQVTSEDPSPSGPVGAGLGPPRSVAINIEV